MRVVMIKMKAPVIGSHEDEGPSAPHSSPPRFSHVFDLFRVWLSCLSLPVTGIQFYFTESIKEARVLAAPCLVGADLASEITATASSEDFSYMAAMTSRFMADISTVSDLCWTLTPLSVYLKLMFHILSHTVSTTEIATVDWRKILRRRKGVHSHLLLDQDYAYS
ncbi:hypothetical protein FCM35_KLT05580 [Carex littledalei]|uniref:Uncharacterized protein n=1 Tax=Carex littledalei TaxID=544730 RepID=A0A833QY95_9POAL|nr:hypothetical protein FCM35_KLT05580 [Carex littledalei]